MKEQGSVREEKGQSKEERKRLYMIVPTDEDSKTLLNSTQI